jgi:hypothetical protein
VGKGAKRRAHAAITFEVRVGFASLSPPYKLTIRTWPIGSKFFCAALSDVRMLRSLDGDWNEMTCQTNEAAN